MKTLVILLLMLIASSLSARADQLSVELNKKLWNHLVYNYNHTNDKKIKDWKVIDQLSMVKKVDDVTIDSAVIATIFKYYDQDSSMLLGFSGDGEESKKWFEKNTPDDKQMVKMLTGIIKRRKELIQEQKTLIRLRAPYYTDGVNVSRMINDSIVKANGDITKGLGDFSQRRGYELKLNKQKSANFNDLKDVIDSKTPVLLRCSNQVLLLLGYIQAESVRYGVAVDLNKIDFIYMSHALNSTSPEIVAKSEELDKQFGLMKLDRKFKIEDELISGTIFVNLTNNRCSAEYLSRPQITEKSVDTYFKTLLE